MDVIQQRLTTPTTAPIPTPALLPTKDIETASVYYDPPAIGRYRVLVMRQYPRNVPMKRPNGTLACDLWVPDAAPSRQLLTWLHDVLQVLRAASSMYEPLIRAQFMQQFVQEVSERLIGEIVFYYLAATDKGWRREPCEVAPRDGKRERVLDWLLHNAEWLQMTLLCHEKVPADPEEEMRGLYCHRAALYKLLHAPDVDSVRQHYQQIEEEARAKILAE